MMHWNGPRRRARIVALLGVLGVLYLALVPVRTLSAQDRSIGTGQRQVSPELDHAHWAVSAVRRAEALGLIEQLLPAQARLPRDLVGRSLDVAAEQAAERSPEYLPLARSWVARFNEEFPSFAENSTEAIRPLGHQVSAGVRASRDVAVPGRALFPETRTGAAFAADTTVLLGAAEFAFALGSHASIHAAPFLSTDRAALDRWDVAVGWRGVRASVGRAPIAYGQARGGGLVIAGREPLTRIQLHSAEGFRLPGLLGHAGLISLHGFGGWLHEPRHAGDPYIWGMSIGVKPHARLTLGVHRGSIIGGDSVPTPLTAGNFLRTFVGHNLLGFENEVVSLEARWRLPTEGLLPITLYGEWGAEDAAGAWRDVPGRTAGIEIAGIPGVVGLSGGAEYTSFAGSCCGNPPWYRHAPHTGGWVGKDRPLGHALGGQGREASLHASYETMEARWRFTSRAFTRSRTGENLYVPGLDGRSNGLTTTISWRAGARSEATVSGDLESGDGWTQSAAALYLGMFF
jgi:hypothetical protein